jgi:hypothetical protein
MKWTLPILCAASVATADPTPAERVTPDANKALDAAYAAFAKGQDVVAPKHQGPWVTAEQAKVTGDAKKGFTVSWSVYPPSGFEYEATLTVDAKRKVKVVKAVAMYSPE